MNPRWSACLVLLLVGCGGSSPSGPSAPPPTTLAPATGTTLGPAGGTVTSTDGLATLRVPAGALPSPVALTLRVGFAPLDPSLVGLAYAIAPDGTRFQVPAELSIGYDGAPRPLGAPEDAFRVQRVNGTEWQALGGRVDTGARRAVAEVEGAGIYAVRWPEPPPTCTSAADAEFDFWLGDWTYMVGGRAVGPNQIRRAAGACVVHENYLNGQGRSVSFRGSDGAWYQTYVQGNTRLTMRGVREGRRMVLYTAATARQVWDPVSADRVLYFAETTTDGGATWSTPASPNEYVRR